MYIMSDDKKNDSVKKPFHYSGHNPKSRRQFMAQGFLGMTAFALAPDLLMKGANAQTAAGCVQAASAGLTPVIIIDLAGGGHIPGSNVIVGGAGGQMNFLQSYSSLGLNANEHPSLAGQVNQDLGIAFHSQSGILRGIKDVAAMNTQLQMDGTLFATISNDDTGNNQHNPMYWLNKAGAKGRLTQLAGTSDSASGGNSMAPAESVNPTVAPVRITSANDARNLVSLGGALTGTFNNNQMDAILKSSAAVSKNKLDAIPRRSLPEAIKQIVSCGFTGTADQVKQFAPNVVDPTMDATITAVFAGITDVNIRNRAAPIVKLVLDGFIGAGTIVLGGYDYHNNTRTTGDAMDRELGQLIGAIVETAARKQKDVVVYVLTDGGVGTNGAPDPTNGRPVWTGDNGERSSTLMLVYKKDGRPAMRSNRRQVGYFQANGAVNPTAMLTSNSVVNTSKAMVANYLALHGLEGKLEQVVSDDPFRLQLDNYLMFDKLR
jgi:hypothetical protein